MKQFEVKQYERPLVYVDPTASDDLAGFELALAYAQKMNVPLSLLTVVDDSSWSLLGHSKAAESVVQETLRMADEKLRQLTKQVEAKGIECSSSLVTGIPFVEIINTVVKDRHDIVIKTMMGKQEKTMTAYGSTARRLLRKCPGSILLVHPNAKSLTRIAASIGTDEFEGDAHGINEVLVGAGTVWSRFADAPLEILHAWSAYGANFLSSRMAPEEFKDYVSGERDAAFTYLREALDAINADIPEDRLHLLYGIPQEVIPEALPDAEHDLLIMGSVARKGIRGLLLGNTAESILENLRCSVLVIKPADFESPVVS